MKKFIEVPNVKSSKRIGKPKVLEKGDVLWDHDEAVKREQIIKAVGMEYKQINLIAQALYVIVSKDKELLNNPAIKEAMEKFETINKIRQS